MAIQQFAPINYAAMIPDIDLSQSILAGAQIRQQRQAQQLKQAEFDQAQAKKAQWDEALLAVASNPTAEGFSQLMLINPEASEAVKRGWDTLNDDRKSADLRELGQIRGALMVGKPDVAKAAIQRRIEADRKAGEDIADDEAMLALIDADAAKAAGLIDYQLASILGPENYAESLAKFGSERRADELQPATVREGKADATTAEVEAEFADDKAVTEIADKQNAMRNRDAGTAIAAGQLDVSRQNARTSQGQLGVSQAAEAREAAAAGTGPKLTEGQGKGVLYLGNAKTALTQLNRLGEKFAINSRSLIADSWAPGASGNALMSAKQQEGLRAAEAFVAATMRQESGAVIPPDEMQAGIRRYFPIAGDSEQVRKNKAALRLRALSGLKTIAGPGAKLVTDDAPSSPPKPAAPKQTKIIRVKADTDYAKVPKGHVYIAPDGSRRRKS